MTKKSSFTLIELLVVIFIIALLASVIVVSVNYVRKKGRDAERIADLTKVAAALQNYYLDHQSYPVSLLELGASAWEIGKYPHSKGYFLQVVEILYRENYLESCLLDPKTQGIPPPPGIGQNCSSALPSEEFNSDWGYRYVGVGDAASGYHYSIAVHLETTSGATGRVPANCEPGDPNPLPEGSEFRINDGKLATKAPCQL